LAEHIGQPCLRIDVVELGRHDQRGRGRRPVSAALGTGEEPRLSPQRKSSKRFVLLTDTHLILEPNLYWRARRECRADFRHAEGKVFLNAAMASASIQPAALSG
jgi:hypothetical protein